MVNVDADGDRLPGTYNSSSAVAEFPSGDSVLWAGLYWGARLTKGDQGAAAPSGRDQMRLRGPGDTAYRTITSQDEMGPTEHLRPGLPAVRRCHRDRPGPRPRHLLGGQRGRRHRQGPLRRVGTGGRLPRPDAAAAQPQRVRRARRRGGRRPADGRRQRASSPRSSGTVDVQLGMVAYEGDLGSTGDTAFLEGTRLGTDDLARHQLLQQHQRPQRRPSSATGTRVTATCSGSTSRRSAPRM